ncbi:MAG: LuxR C-terminal-related transcriptional regulator [Sphingobacteriales bacterium]
MKSKNDISFTYMGNLQQAWYANEAADTNDINGLLQKFKNFGGSSHHSFPIFFVIDYIARQYLVMTEAMQNIAGYHPREFIESGLDKLIDVFHKEDFEIFNQQVFARNTAFLKATPQQEHHQFIFSYNFRFLRRDKKWANLLQRGSFITSKETGLPLYSLGMVMDINDFKSDNVMVHTIEKNVGESGHRQKISTDYFYPNQEDTLLTPREKLVLQYLSEGYSSKQAADKLFVSERTIVNHKQNMLRKTNTKNIVELVVFAITNRLI